MTVLRSSQRRGCAMAVLRDPEQAETRAIHRLIDFWGADVLEVGCGDGRLTWRYAERTRSVLALDPATAAIEHARASLPDQWRPAVTLPVSDMTRGDLPRAAVD